MERKEREIALRVAELRETKKELKSDYVFKRQHVAAEMRDLRRRL